MTEMMADKPSVREFMRGFRERWFTAMSGGASVPFAIASVLSPEKYQQLIFATLAITCAGFACFRVWKHERERVNELEESLRPKIGVSLDQICGGLRIVKTDYVEGSRVRPGPDHKWAQINITPLTNAPLVDCEVRVTSAEQGLILNGILSKTNLFIVLGAILFTLLNSCA